MRHKERPIEAKEIFECLQKEGLICPELKTLEQEFKKESELNKKYPIELSDYHLWQRVFAHLGDLKMKPIWWGVGCGLDALLDGFDEEPEISAEYLADKLEYTLESVIEEIGPGPFAPNRLLFWLDLTAKLHPVFKEPAMIVNNYLEERK